MYQVLSLWLCLKGNQMNRVFYSDTRRRLKRERRVSRYKKLLSTSERLKKFSSGRSILAFHQVPRVENGDLFVALNELVSEGRVETRKRRIASKIRSHVLFYRLT